MLASKSEAAGFAVNGGCFVRRRAAPGVHVTNQPRWVGTDSTNKITLKNKLHRTPEPQFLDLLELAVDARLDAADREQIDPGFGLPGLDLVADPELPFPDSRDRRHRHRVFDASVVHGKPPPPLTHVNIIVNTIQYRIFRYHAEISVIIAPDSPLSVLQSAGLEMKVGWQVGCGRVRRPAHSN